MDPLTNVATTADLPSEGLGPLGRLFSLVPKTTYTFFAPIVCALVLIAFVLDKYGASPTAAGGLQLTGSVLVSGLLVLIFVVALVLTAKTLFEKGHEKSIREKESEQY